MNFELLSSLLFLMSWFTFCTCVSENKVQKQLAEAVNLIKTVNCGHCLRGETYIRQYIYVSPCSELNQLKETRIALDKNTAKALLLQQLMSRGKYHLYESQIN